MARSPTYAQSAPGHVSIQPEHIAGEGLTLDRSWLYHPGDDPAWAAPSFPDSTWEAVDSNVYPENMPQSGWPGVGWFRIHLYPDTSLADVPLGLQMWQIGSTDVFLDGERIYHFAVGDSTDPTVAYAHLTEILSLPLEAGSAHVLAVRHANPAAPLLERASYRIGFSTDVGDLQAMFQRHTRQVQWDAGLQMFFMGALLVLCILHLLLFAFYRSAKEHLYYAVFTASIALLSHFIYQLSPVVRAGDLLTLLHWWNVAAVIAPITAVRFVYILFRKPVPRYFYVFVAAGLALIVWSAVDSTLVTRIVNFYTLAGLLEFARAIAVGVYRNWARSWYVGVGALLFMAGGLQGLVVRMDFVEPTWNVNEFYLLGIGALLFSMSAHLARNVGRTNRDLHTQLDQVRKLSAQMTEEVVQRRLLEAQANMMVELDEAKGRFFANISHEFRTPLTLILGPVENAVRGSYGALPEELVAQLQTTHHHTRNLLHLVNQLLDLAHLESGKMVLQPEALDLAGFVQGVTQSFSPLADRKQITLQFRSGVPELVVLFDAEKLEKVIGNLLSNALKFTPEGGKVWVTLTRPKGDGDTNSVPVEIAVKDTGPGIGAKDVERIFNRFEQADGSSTRRHEGTGIGLALAKELTELHGGRIHVASEEGFGTTFTVCLRLPHASLEAGAVSDGTWTGDGNEANVTHEIEPDWAAREKQPAEYDCSEEQDQTKPRLLIVEDNPDVRHFLRTQLEHDYHIFEAADGAAGLQAARRYVPDLIVADVMMPEKDGYALSREIKADMELHHIPVILLTARAAEEDTVAGLQSGADDYVVKPFNIGELGARIARLIDSRRRLRAQFSREVVIQPTGVVIQSAEEAFLNQVVAVVEQHLSDSRFGVDTLADEVGLSRRQLERKVRDVTGEAPGELIRHMRLERARQMLEGGAGTVAEIAYAVGFGSPSHFSAAFRQHFGTSPSAYTKKTT